MGYSSKKGKWPDAGDVIRVVTCLSQSLVCDSEIVLEEGISKKGFNYIRASCSTNGHDWSVDIYGLTYMRVSVRGFSGEICQNLMSLIALLKVRLSAP